MCMYRCLYIYLSLTVYIFNYLQEIDEDLSEDYGNSRDHRGSSGGGGGHNNRNNRK